MAEQSPTARLTAWARKNRIALGVGAVGLAAVLALLARRRAAQGGAATSDPSVTVPAGGQTVPMYGAAGYYDSTATDLYNAITPQLQGLQRQIEELKLTPGPVAPAPQPTGPLPADAGQLWDAFQGQQLAGGRLVMPGGGARDWGMVARETLGTNATKFDVYVRALELQKLNPQLHASNPMYVPAGANLTLPT